MLLLHAIDAEQRLLRARALRSRLGMWLGLLAASALWLTRPADAAGLATFAVRVAMLGAVLAVGAGGSGVDRAFLGLALTHPTTPLALGAGRWLATTTAATTLALGCLAASTALSGAAALVAVRAAVEGAAAAGATAACTLVLVWAGRGEFAAALFLYIALFGTVSPDDLCAVLAPGALRRVAIGTAEIAPSIWRYRRLAGGDVAAWGHALAWVAGGVPLAALCLRRRSL